MDFSLSAEQRAIQEAARDFARGEVDPIVDEIDEAQRFPREVMKKAGELGFLGVLFPEELGKHHPRVSALGQAVAVATVGAGDVVVGAQRLADADCDRLLADVEVRQARHEGARVQIVDPLLEEADGQHLTVHPQQLVDAWAGCRR